MAFGVSDTAIFFTPFILGLFFQTLACYFPIKTATGPKVAPGTVWLWIRAIVFPFLAGINWFVMAAFSIVAANSGTTQLYLIFYGLFAVDIVIGIGMTLYLAFHPAVEVLEGRDGLGQS